MNQLTDITLATEQLLRDLITTYTCDPDQVELEVKEHPGRVVWKLKVSAADMPLLCGKQGTHSKALLFLAGEIGKNADKFYAFTILDPEPGPSGEKKNLEPAATYDPDPARELLERLLSALGVGEFSVQHEPRGRHADGRLENDFVIYVRDDDDYRLLTVPTTVERDAQPIITAIGTLYRAAANKQGVRCHVQVTKVP